MSVLFIVCACCLCAMSNIHINDIIIIISSSSSSSSCISWRVQWRVTVLHCICIVYISLNHCSVQLNWCHRCSYWCALCARSRCIDSPLYGRGCHGPIELACRSGLKLIKNDWIEKNWSWEKKGVLCGLSEFCFAIVELVQLFAFLAIRPFMVGGDCQQLVGAMSYLGHL